MNKTKLCLIGGGHGLSTVLAAVKKYTYISAIVAVTDTGGSTGNIRSKFECPAIGDIRRCLDSLSNEEMRGVFEKRFKEKGDCVGNLIIASLIKLYDFETAIKMMHKLLGLKETHKIIPVSLDNFDICGTYQNNKPIKKETDFKEEEKIADVWLDPIPKANKEAIEAIRESDWVIIVPGSFFTSIMANFLIPEITKEVNKKKIIWIVNAMQQFGETIGMDATTHLDYLSKYINKIDYLILNSEKPTDQMLKSYHSYLMPLLDIQVRDNVKKIIKEDIIKYSDGVVAHSPFKLLQVLRGILHE